MVPRGERELKREAIRKGAVLNAYCSSHLPKRKKEKNCARREKKNRVFYFTPSRQNGSGRFLLCRHRFEVGKMSDHPPQEDGHSASRPVQKIFPSRPSGKRQHLRCGLRFGTDSKTCQSLFALEPIAKSFCHGFPLLA